MVRQVKISKWYHRPKFDRKRRKYNLQHPLNTQSPLYIRLQAEYRLKYPTHPDWLEDCNVESRYRELLALARLSTSKKRVTVRRKGRLVLTKQYSFLYVRL